MARAKVVAFCCWVLILTLHHVDEFCCRGAEVALRGHHHVVQMASLVPASTCSGSYTDGARPGKMRVSHRYGPCSPLSREDQISPSSAEILRQDELRVKNLNAQRAAFRRLGGQVRGSRLPTYGGPIGAGNFVINVGFGTPAQYFTMIFDTGSKQTWIQCIPCSNTSCYTQQDPLFDPSASATYSNASCEFSPSCDYHIEYGDKSSSSGQLVRDTFTLTPTDTYSNFIFGCGYNNQGNFGKAAGMLGFGSDVDPLSFISQTAGSVGMVFCYCLPAADSSVGHISFGAEALTTCSSDIYTSLIQYRYYPSFYFIRLNGITVAGEPLEIPPFLTILDSGTVITRLPPSVYNPLKSAFMKSMSQYPPAPPLTPLMDTCYNLTGYGNFTAPEMALQLGGSSEIRLHPAAVIWRESDSQVCLAFAGNKEDTDKAIIGNHQQKTLNILYEIRAGEISFSSQGC
uniref:Peptidase A1 domain-containing protein n=1 Tax=Kalanchoe fedtschenkoi TaxID=63787 RepID=A0A7N0TB18_KALFE